MYLAGIPAQSIMKITGHTTEASFMKYLRITKEQNEKLLADNDFFTVRECRVADELSLASQRSFRHIICLAGSGTVGGEPIVAGDSYFLPSGYQGSVLADAPLHLLITEYQGYKEVSVLRNRPFFSFSKLFFKRY